MRTPRPPNLTFDTYGRFETFYIFKGNIFVGFGAS